MFYLRPPTDAAIRTHLRSLANVPFPYEPVGTTRSRLAAAPHGFHLDAYGAELGTGQACFDRARDALTRIDNYPDSFTRVVRDFDALAAGSLFATVAKHLGFASVHPCRVIYVVDEPDRYGFGFGTLPGHAELGEESFFVARRRCGTGARSRWRRTHTVCNDRRLGPTRRTDTVRCSP